MRQRIIGHKIMPENIGYNKTEFAPSYVHKFVDASDFAEKKIKMLRDEFCVDLSAEDELYLKCLKSEGEINAAVKKMLNKYW